MMSKNSSMHVLLVLCFTVMCMASLEQESTVLQSNKRHDLVLGVRQEGDRLLYRKYIFVFKKQSGVVHSEVKYPASDNEDKTVITRIEVFDTKRDGNSGYPSLQDGGIGDSRVTIQLTSQQNHGLHYNASIYGI